MTNPETRGTILDRIRTRVAAGLRSDEGFVLLDVLIGIAVLALLLLTAIQSIGPMRQRSYQSSTQSDARQVATAFEAFSTDNPSVGAPVAVSSDVATLTVNATGPVTVASDVNLSSGNRLGWYLKSNTDANAYLVCIEHLTGTAEDAATLYNSMKGAIVKTARGTGCSAAAPAQPADATAFKAYNTL